MDPSAFPLLFVLLAAVAIGLAVLGHRAKLQRQRDMAAVARNHGLDFSVDDPFSTLTEPFSLLRRGDGRGVENVSWGVWQGLEVRAFDYWFYDESTDSNGRTSRSYSRFDCVLVPVDASCPRLSIERENVLTRLADALTLRDLAFESEEFNRRFNVTADDARFATALCDARMMAWLLEHGDGYGFEVVGDRMLCWCARVPPAGIVHAIGIAKAFHDRIPDVVRSLYPNG